MSSNGTEPVTGPGLAAHIEQAQSTRAHVIAELRELHEAESRILDELTKQQGEARARRDSYKRALDNLGAPTERTVAVERAERATKPGAKAKTGSRGGRIYRPNEKFLDEVIAALRASDKPLAHADLMETEQVTCSPETLSRAIRVLREEGRLRIAKQVQQRPYYALMPDA